MGFLKKLTRLFTPDTSPEDRARYIYVQCSRCGEKIATRVDLLNDLSPVYEENGVTYFCRKVIMGSGEQHCFQKIEVELRFDSQRRLAEQKITAGRFITREDMQPESEHAVMS